MNLPANVGPGHSWRIRRRRIGGAGGNGARCEAVVSVVGLIEAFVRFEH
jgi:hypothetical protein